MTLVLGLGLRPGTPYDEVQALVTRVLAGVARASRAVAVVATMDSRTDEPAVLRLAADLGAVVCGFGAEALDGQPVAARSARVAAAVGTASVAEAAVLATGAELVVGKHSSPNATVAVGRHRHVGRYAPGDREAVHRVLAQRRDVRRGFLPEPVEDAVLQRVLDGAHRAPSVGLSQPWDFLLIRDVDTRRSVRDLAMAQRDAFAASLPPDRRTRFDGLKIEAILDTPLNIAVTCDPGRGGRHVLGRHADPRTTWFSVAIAVQNLWLAARAEGVGVGWVSFFDPDEVAGVLDLPRHVELVGYLCVGYVDEFGDTPELVRSGWAARRPLSWAVHHERWGRRGLPGEPPGSIVVDAATARPDGSRPVPTGPTTGDDGRRTRVLVTESSPPDEQLTESTDLAVHVGTRPDRSNAGVLWLPARSADEATEHGVELARDLWLHGTRWIDTRVVDPTAHTAALVDGIRLGAAACGMPVGAETEC